MDPIFWNYHRDFYLNKIDTQYQCFISPTLKVVADGWGLKKIFARTIKQRTCEPAQKKITGTVKGELEAQDKGGPRSQETNTVTDKISTRLKDE